MLTFFRRHSQSQWVKGLYVVIALSFLIGFGAFGYVSRTMKRSGRHFGDEASWVAKVNGQAISPEDLLRAQRAIETNVRRQDPEAADAWLARNNVNEIALQQLVQARVFDLLAAKMGLTVTDEELASDIYRMPQFQAGGRFDRDRYLSALRRQRLTPQEFEAQERSSLTAAKLENLVRLSVKVADSDVRANFDASEDKIDLQFVKLTPGMLDAPVTFADEDVKKYYEDNKDKFRAPEKRKVNYATFNADDYADKIAVTPEQIKAYYDANKDKEFKQEEEIQARHILIAAKDPAKRDAAKAKAEALRKELAGGADFSDLAKKNSDDPGSKDKGGDLGWFGRGQMAKPFEDAAFALKVNELSPVVETEFGFHIIQLTGKKPEKTQELAEVSDKIAAQLKKDEGQKRALADAASFRAKLAEGADLLKVGAEQGVKVATSSPFGANQPIPGLPRGLEAARAAFGMKVHEIGEPVDAGSAVFVFQLAEIVEAHPEDFAEAGDQARQGLKVQLERKALSEKAAGIIGALQKGEPFAKAAGKLTVEDTGPFTGGMGVVPKIGMAPELVEAASSLTKEKPVLPKAVPAADGVAVVVLKDRVVPSEADFLAKADQIRGELQKRKADLTLAAWLEQAQKTVKIEYNQATLSEVTEGKYKPKQPLPPRSRGGKRTKRAPAQPTQDEE